MILPLQIGCDGGELRPLSSVSSFSHTWRKGFLSSDSWSWSVYEKAFTGFVLVAEIRICWIWNRNQDGFFQHHTRVLWIRSWDFLGSCHWIRSIRLLTAQRRQGSFFPAIWVFLIPYRYASIYVHALATLGLANGINLLLSRIDMFTWCKIEHLSKSSLLCCCSGCDFVYFCC